MREIIKYSRLILIFLLLLPGATVFANDSLKVKEVICAYENERRPGKSYQEKFFFDREGNLIKKVILRPYSKFYNKKNHTDTLYYFSNYVMRVAPCNLFDHGTEKGYCADTFGSALLRDYSLQPFNWKLVSQARSYDSTQTTYISEHYRKDSLRENIYVSVSDYDRSMERKILFDEQGRITMDSIVQRDFVDCPVGNFLWSTTEYDSTGNLIQYHSRNVGTFNNDEFFEYDPVSGRIVRFSRNFLTSNEAMWFYVYYTFY